VWFRRFHAADVGAPRLLCFPHAGAAAGTYRRLSAALSPYVEVTAVQYPGRQDRRTEPVRTDLGELAGLIRAELAGPGGTPAFFGHSMGAIVAFEVARGLSTPPPVLFAAARRAPSRGRQERTHPMSDQEIRSELVRLGGTDARLLDSRAFGRTVLPVLRGDYEAIDTYRYRSGAPLACPVVVLAGKDDPLTPVADARAWHRHAAAGGDTHLFAGGHFFLDEHRSRIAEIVLDRLVPSAPARTGRGKRRPSAHSGRE
jgi:pyochelin biosynthetic protein PchC